MRIILSLLLLELCMCCHAQINQELLFPHANHVSNASLVNFQWNRNPNIPNQYRFQLSLDSNFVNILIDDTTAAGTYSVGPLGPTNTCYYWRVRSLNPASSWSWVRKYYFFNPNNLNGLVAWLAPSNGVNLAGNSIIGMTDQGVFNNNAFQNTAAQRPTFIPSDSIINNQASVKYDGSNDFLEMSDSPSLDFTTEFTAHALVKPSVIAVNKTILAKWDYQTQGSWVWQTEFSTADEYMFSPCFTVTDPGNQKVITTNADMVVNKPTLMTLTYNANTQARATYHKNFQVLNTSTVGTIPQYLPNSTATLKVGKYGGTATRYYQGDITEVLLFNNAQNDSLRNLVDSYLRFKYCPPVNLGPDTLISSTLNCGNIQLKPSYRFTSYLWSTGSTASRIFVQQPGKYWVTVTDFMGVVSKDTIEVKPPYSFNKPASNVLCQGQSMTWTTNFPTNSFSFLWQNGSTSPSMTITQPGPYFVKVTDNNGCFVRSDTLMVTLDTYPTTAFLGADTSLCIGNSISLQIGVSETVSYVWNNGQTGETFSITNPGNYAISLLATNINGCISEDTINVTVNGTAPSNNVTLPQSQCTNALLQFSNQASVPLPALISSQVWTFSNGLQLNGNTVQTTFPTTGYIYGSIEVTASDNCSSLDTFSFYVHVPPTLNIQHSGSCNNELILFQATDLSGNPLSTYTWDYLGGFVDTDSIGSHLFSQAGLNQITLVAQNTYGCSDTAAYSFNVLAAPSSIFTINNSCEETLIYPLNSSIGNDTTGIQSVLWDFGNGAIDTAFNAPCFYTSEGNYSVSLICYAGNGCSDTTTQTITIQPSPLLSWNLAPACKDNPTVFTSTSTISSGTIDSTSWLVNLQYPIDGIQGQYSFTTLGIQFLTLSAVSNMGCLADTLIQVNVNPGLSSSFVYEPAICIAGDELTLSSTANGSNTIDWVINDVSYEDTISLNYLIPDSLIGGDLFVYSITSNLYGCSDTTLTVIPINEPLLELALNQVYLGSQNSQSIIGCSIQNEGTVSIVGGILTLSVSGIPRLSGTLNDTILPGDSYYYIFENSPNLAGLSQNNTVDFVCVSADLNGFHFMEEQNLSNNYACLLIEEGTFSLGALSPNPVTNQSDFPLILTEKTPVTVEVFDVVGNLCTRSENILEAGTHILSVLMNDKAAGVYFLRVRVGSEHKILQFIKI